MSDRISACGNGDPITPGGRIAKLERDQTGHLVAHSGTTVTDDMMFAVIDAGRR